MFVVTFYSYKGGVGRTMALVNVAALLAQSGKRVLIVDFDLEAPGIPSYGPHTCALGAPGIVDYVHEYLDTNASPNVADFIVECPLEDGCSVWVMPAGDNSAPGYSDRFASIDWGDLYENRHGFLMMEDMRNQWAEYDGSGFDYVLVDSRTGNTDIGGICTRQLPNAVVIMFVPTKQNVDGLVPVVDLIRREEGPKGEGIDLVFCPSNIPDLFDEDDILGRSLTMAAERLRYGSPAHLEPPITKIHHWASMELLEQPLIVTSRKNSRLANEYRELKAVIVGQNSADREGAIYTLDRMPEIYDSAREAGRGEVATRILDRAKDIVALHAGDGDVAFKAAEVFSLAGDYPQEERCLSDVIAADIKRDRARLLRAVARLNLDNKAGALDDLKAILTSEHGSSFEFRPAVAMLSAVSDAPVAEAKAIFMQEGVKVRSKMFLAQLLMQDRANLDLVADQLLSSASDEVGLSEMQLSDVRNTISLALIGARRFKEAEKLSNFNAAGRSIPDMFNSAIAQWGLIDQPPMEIFAALDAAMTGFDGDPNTHQCIALVRSVVGNPEAALKEITLAEERILPSALAFSCWTFLYRGAEEFRADLQEMRAALDRGVTLRPPFLPITG